MRPIEKRLDRQIAAKPAVLDDLDELPVIGAGRFSGTAEGFLDLPVQGVWDHHPDVHIGVIGEVFAGIHQGAAPLVVDTIEQALVFGARVQEVAVVLHGDLDAELLPVLGARTNASAIQPSTSSRFARPEAACQSLCGACGPAKTRMTGAPIRAATSIHSLVNVHARGAHGLVRGREVIAHARAADVETEVLGMALDPVEVAVVRGPWGTGEEVARQIDGVEVRPAAKSQTPKRSMPRLGSLCSR